jgi:hypothetical protein
VRVWARHRGRGREARLAKLQRLQDLLLDHLLDGLPRDLLEDHAQERVVRVAVLHAGARSEVRVVALDDRDHVLGREGKQRVAREIREEGLVHGEVVDPRGHPEQVADRDLVAVGDSGDVRLQLVLETELPLIDEL